MGDEHKPMLNGRVLSQSELEKLRLQIESFDAIGEVRDEIRQLIAQQWPHLLARTKAKGPH